MIELRPCSECQRHVAITETTCPFCRVSLVAAEPRSLVRGRLSRAAVFASATLATTAACGGGKPKVDHKDTGSNTVQADAGTTEPPKPDAAPAEPERIPDHMQPKPYGAPPARRRVV